MTPPNSGFTDNNSNLPNRFKDMNDGANFWRNHIGVETLPAISKEKKPLGSWKKYQTEPATDEEFQSWLDNDKFKDGVCILTGRVRHRSDRRHLFYVVIDGDRAAGIKELLTRNGHTPTLQEVSKQWIVEQHKDNPEKGHFAFYSPIRFPEKSPDPIIGLEIRCEDNEGKTGRVIMVSPSIHQDGYPYDIIGTKDPCIMTELQARELIQHINQICIRNGVEYLTKVAGSSKLNAKIKQMCKKLTIDNSVEISKGQRNDILIAIADSILLRHSTRHSEDYLREFFDKINKQLCKPPLDGRELDSIWQRASNFTEKIKEEQKQADETKRKTICGNGEDSDYIPEEIHNEIGDDIYLKINDNPIILIITQKKSGRIVLAKVNERAVGEGHGKYVSCYLSVKNTVIDAVPTRVIINESPIDGVKTYQITFSHKGAGRPFTVGPNTVKAIIAELQDRGRYIDKDADKFLTGILTKYEDNELAEFNNQVLQSGYYLVDDKIVGYDITQSPNREISQQEAKDCINVIEGLLPKYRKKEIIPTVIKWGIVAPFSYVKKCHSLSGSNWLPALAPYGRKRTGKNTIGIIALAISRKHTVKDKPIHQIGVGSIDSPARLGKAISRTTYPVMSSEVDLANERLDGLLK